MVVADRVVIVDDRHHPQRLLAVVGPYLADDLRFAIPFVAGLGESLADVGPVLDRGGGNRLDVIGLNDGGQALADRLPTIVILRAGKYLRLRIRECRRRAGGRTDAR